jgi:hypothetical protein
MTKQEKKTLFAKSYSGLIQEMKLFPWLEPHRFSWRDAHLGTRPRVASDARLPWFHREDPEPAKLDPLPCDQRLLHAVENCIDGRFRLRSRKSGSLYNSLNEILLDQDGDAFPLSL